MQLKLTETQDYVFYCCRSLSSGTMATLTGESLYLRLDAIQAEFVKDVLKAFEQGAEFDTWVDAWNEFKGKHPEYARENKVPEFA